MDDATVGSTAAIGAGDGGAAAAVADPPATGGGDGGAADGTGADDGAGASEGAGDGTGADPAGEGAGDGAEGAGEGEGGEEPTEEDPLGLGDGRTIDDKTKKAFADFKKVNPQAEKLLRENYFKAQHIMSEVDAPNLSEALTKVRNMAAVLDGLGGEEGITEMRTEVEDYRNEIRQFRDGDPQLFETLYNADGSGAQLGTSLGNALDFMASKSLKMFDTVMVPRMVARLNQVNFIPSMPVLLEHIQKGDGEAAYKLAKEMKQFLDNASKFATDQKTNAKTPNPEAEALARDRVKLDQDRNQIRDDKIGAEVNRQNNTATAKVVSDFMKDVGLKPEGRRRFINQLNSSIYAKMAADKSFQASANNLKNKGDVVKASRFISAKFTELLTDTFREVRDELYPSYSKKSGGGGARTAANNGAAKAVGSKTPVAAVKIAANSKPDREQVDWNKTTNTMWISGRAYLKDGNLHKWNWKDV